MALTRASAAVVKTEELVNNRNLIINGAMQIAQRNTSVTGITTLGYYTADHWSIDVGSAGTWTMNVESSGPTGTEFRKSANVICTTADSSLSSGDNLVFQQRFEGQNLQGIKKGTANAESLTLSFYVKSSNTGTYICEFFDADNTRQISKSYTINAANTWEKKTITVPPDTTGQFDNDNALSLYLQFWLASGSDRTSGTLNDTAWATSVQTNRVVGQLNLANRIGNYWAVTGVQLERGSTETPYEWRDYQQELAMCQRYFYQWSAASASSAIVGSGQAFGSTSAYILMKTPMTMRAPPSTFSSAGSFGSNNASGGGLAVTAISLVSSWTNENMITLQATVSSGWTAGNVALMNAGADATCRLNFSAEL